MLTLAQTLTLSHIQWESVNWLRAKWKWRWMEEHDGSICSLRLLGIVKACRDVRVAGYNRCNQAAANSLEKISRKSCVVSMYTRMSVLAFRNIVGWGEVIVPQVRDTWFSSRLAICWPLLIYTQRCLLLFVFCLVLIKDQAHEILWCRREVRVAWDFAGKRCQKARAMQEVEAWQTERGTEIFRENVRVCQ